MQISKNGVLISKEVPIVKFLAVALEWVSKGNIDSYMAQHRHDNDINEIKRYFNSVIDWVSTVFTDVEKEMCGLEWGMLYEKYHTKPYNALSVSKEVQKLYGDPYVKSRKGVFEYILGGMIDTKLLEVKFDKATKTTVYKKQTAEATQKGN